MIDFPPNPYYARAMIHEPEMFFGRTDLLRRLYELVAHRQCVSITGLRSIGKSSFLWYASLSEVQARSPFYLSRHLFVFLDLREFLRKTSEDFFHTVCEEMIAAGAKQGLALQSNGKGEDEFSNILDQIEEQSFCPVLLLDAFDRITRNKHFDPEFFEFLRAHASLGKVSYVTASIAPLSEICHSGIAGSPFFNIFYSYPMGPLSLEEAKMLITVPAQRNSMVFSDREIDLVLTCAGRHPFFIQRICYLLWEEKTGCTSGEVDEHRLKSRAFKALSSDFQNIWQELSSADQLLIQDEVQQKEKQQRKLPELSESSLFRQFVRNTRKKGLFHLENPKELEEALEKIDDLIELGETNLRLMKMVSARLKNQDAPTAIDKGRAIREVITEALQRLRGLGSQSDGAADWKYYNILYYRYFKSLRNEVIAGRLGLSTRQYYRMRLKAIEMLLNVVVAMEASVDTSDLDEE